MSCFIKKCIIFILVASLFTSCPLYNAAYAAEADEGAHFSNIIMNVGSSETMRNLTWYSNVYADAEVRYAPKSHMQDGAFPLQYSVAKAIGVKTSSNEWSYKATMSGLKSDTSYVYCLVVGNTVSDIYNFAVQGGNDFSFAYITDPQLDSVAENGTEWGKTLEKITSEFPDVSFMVSGGDQISNPTKEDQYDNFIADSFTSTALATSVGTSHDTASLYSEHYNLANLSSTCGVSETSSDYFYKYNNALFMHVNVESGDYTQHIKFVKNAISDNPDCIWKIVVIHYSFFSGGHHSADSSVTTLRNSMADDFCQSGVDLVLSGHDHSYARSHLMLDGTTMSDDVVTDNTVTNPKGTMYVCGTSASGIGFYDALVSEDDKYIACKRTDKRNGFVKFDITETSLSMNSYFLDGEVSEKFDSFTINKSVMPFKLNGKSSMIEYTPDNGNTRIPLVGAYAYSKADVRVINSVWSLSTDGGESYNSLGIEADSDNYSLRTDSKGKYWEYSQDGGESYISTGISTSAYSVRYVTVPGADHGDGTDLSLYAKRFYTAQTPDEPVISLPKGSVSEGFVYDWAWKYYCITDGGDSVSEFEAGKEYVAYLDETKLPVSDTMYISESENPQSYTYTWADMWNLVKRCNGDSFTIVLKDNITLESSDYISFATPVNVTLDLNGKTLDITQSGKNYAFWFTTGSSGSVFNVITSAENGTIKSDSKYFINLGTGRSTLSIGFGSEDTFPLTVNNGTYLVNGGSSFANSSTLNLDIYSGSYTVTSGIMSISNVSATAGKNIYNIKLKNADFTFKGDTAYLVKNASGMYARDTSTFVAEGCSFKNADSPQQKPILGSDPWLGTMKFISSSFDGMYFDAEKIPSLKSVTIGKGCTFVNSSKSFKDASYNFNGSNIKLESGCITGRASSNGLLEVMHSNDASSITWHNPIGYTEYWKKGVVPSYLGEGEFSAGGKTYSLCLAEEPEEVTADKLYSFKNTEGGIYRYDSAENAWYVSSPSGDGESKIVFGNEAQEASYLVTRQSLGGYMHDAVVYSNLTLPETDGKYGSVITWTSSDEALISNTGVVTRGNYTKSVTLTANISVGENKVKKTFSFRVPGIFDENYNGLTVMNEEFEGSTTISKVVDNTKSEFYQADGCLNVANAESTVASRTDIYLKENKEGFTGNAALEMSVEREDKENEFTLFFKNQAGSTLGRLTFFGESTNFGSAYLYDFETGSGKVKESLSASELGSSSEFIIRIETNPETDIIKTWINGVFMGETSMRGSADISSLQIFKQGSTGNIKFDYIRVSLLDDSYRGAKSIYMDEFNDDATTLASSEEANGFYVSLTNKEKEILMVSEADGGVCSSKNVVVEFDLMRVVGGGIDKAGNNGVVRIADNAGNNIFRLQWLDGTNGLRFYHGTADAKTGSNTYYLIKVAELANYNITNDGDDNDNLYVKALIDNDNKKFTLYINGVRVKIGDYEEFDFYSSSASGVGKLVIQPNSVSNQHRLAAVRCYVPGTSEKPVADATSLDYNAFDKKLSIRSFENQLCKVYVANYTDGVLTSVSVIENTELKANEDTQLSVKSDVLKSADELKIFLWSSAGGSTAPASKNLITSVISTN